MSPTKARILSGTIAIVVAAPAIPIVFAGVLLAWNLVPRDEFDRDSGAQLLMFLALGASLVAAFVMFRRVYNGLCERWSTEIVPPHVKRWPPLYRPF